MSDIEHLIYPLPDSLIKLLSTMVDVALAEKSLDVNCLDSQNYNRSGAYDFTISQGGTERTVEDLLGNPIDSLIFSGFIRRSGQIGIFLHPIAFDRVRYEQKWAISKWWERTWKSGSVLSITSLIISFIAFIISITAGSSSAIIELLKLYKYLPTP